MATKQIDTLKRGFPVDEMPNHQHRIFCLAMLASKGCKPTEAARVAGYKNASVTASKLMKLPHVRAFLGKMQYEREQELKMDGRRILLEVQYCALRDAKDLVDENGLIVENIQDLEPEIRRCIDGIEQKVSTDKYGTVTVETKLKLVPKLGAIELAAKHFGLISPDNHRHEHQHVHINWDDLAESTNSPIDPVEAKIAEVQDARTLVPGTDDGKRRLDNGRENSSGNGSSGGE